MKIIEIKNILNLIFINHRFIKFISYMVDYKQKCISFKFERIDEYVTILLDLEQFEKTSKSQIIWFIINKLENSDII